MTDRDRNDSRYDRNEARFAGRDDPYAQDRQDRDAQDWERRARDWERGGPDDYARGQHARDLRGQHSDLRSQGRGFRDDDYGNQGYDRQRFDRERAYAGPTGSYSGYRDDRNDWNDQRSQGQGWQGNPSYQGNYGSQGSYGARGNTGWQGNNQRFGASPYSNLSPTQRYPQFSQGGYAQHGADRNYARSYEIEGARGEYRGREEDSFGQQLRDGANSVVRSVKRAFRGPKGYKRSDDRIREDVSDRLAQQDQVDPSDIEVQVQNGEVTLTGTVQSRHEKFLAEELADDVSGVSDVHNQLRVRRENEPRASSTSSTTSTLTGQNDPNRVRNGHV
jgi:osmotically-inducible protein OsmY